MKSGRGKRRRHRRRRGGGRCADGGERPCPNCMRDLLVGEQATVVGYRPCDDEYRRRLLDMGLVKGAEFRLVRRAPLGDPVEIDLRGYRLSLRQDEAACLCIHRHPLDEAAGR